LQGLHGGSVSWCCRVRHTLAAAAGVKIGPVRYRGLLLGVAVLIATWQLISARPLDWRPGALVADDPQQVEIEGTEAIGLGHVRLIPHARFSAQVRVLSRERYWLGTFADVSPLDVAVGWGPMSDSAVLADLDISQSGRFYFWHYDEGPPVPREVIESHSANWHLVPANDRVWRTLRNLRIGSVVTLEGMLVDIETADRGTIKTSMRRDDTGAGACEILYVESASLRYR
jgi:hypothetical protein